MIVTVNRPICNVIRIDSTPFRKGVANRLPFVQRLTIFYQFCGPLSIKAPCFKRNRALFVGFGNQSTRPAVMIAME